MFPIKMKLLFLFYFTFAFGHVCVSGTAKLNETQSEAVRETLMQMWNLDPSKNTEAGGTLGNGTSSGETLASGEHVKKKDKKKKMPRHMMELYEKYSEDRVGNGDTVRSLEPMIDFIPYFKDVLTFNVSGLSRLDKIHGAQLHIHRRRLGRPRAPQGSAGEGGAKGTKLPPPCRIRLYHLLIGLPTPRAPKGSQAKELNEIERTKLRSLDSIPIAQVTKGGWYSIEISMALKEMLNSPAVSSSLILGARFEGPRGNSISPQHFLKLPEDNTSSSFVVIFSDDGNQNDKMKNGTSKIKLSKQHENIMAELLQNAAAAAIKSANLKKGEGNVKAEARGDKNTYAHESRHMRRKLKKIENIVSGINAKEPIRHRRKYYRNKMLREMGNLKEDEMNLDNGESNFNPESAKSSSKKKLTHHFSSLAPGDGDIAELLDFETVKKVKALRRHNHKSISGLNLRYDTATKRIVQKKTGKWRNLYSENDEKDRRNNEQSLSENNKKINRENLENNKMNVTRFSRSTHDNELSDYVLEFSGFDDKNDEDKNEDEVAEEPEKVYAKNDREIIDAGLKRDKESYKEDDMGDLSYYEPDVYMHETLIPVSYRHKYNAFDPESERNKKDKMKFAEYDPQTNEVLSDDDDYYKRTKENYVTKGKVNKHHTNKWNLKPRKYYRDDEIEEAHTRTSRAATFSTEASATNDNDVTAFEKRRHKNQNRKLRKSGERTQTSEDAIQEEKNSIPHSSVTEQPVQETCHLAELIVNISDIGWDDYILAPNTFNAGFCTGGCPFNADQSQANFTNHAILQNLVRQLDVRGAIPAPCCVPAKTKPLSMMYMETNQTIKLKTYKDMIVESCECR